MILFRLPLISCRGGERGRSLGLRRDKENIFLCVIPFPSLSFMAANSNGGVRTQIQPNDESPPPFAGRECAGGLLRARLGGQPARRQPLPGAGALGPPRGRRTVAGLGAAAAGRPRTRAPTPRGPRMDADAHGDAPGRLHLAPEDRRSGENPASTGRGGGRAESIAEPLLRGVPKGASSARCPGGGRGRGSPLADCPVVSFQLVDLGEPPYSHASSSGGCAPQDAACPGGVGGCGHRGRCVGGLVSPECECEPGWTAPGCTMPTVPASLGPASYMKVALSFAAAGRGVRVQVRVRTRGARDGLLLHLAARHRRAALSLHVCMQLP